MRVSQDDLGNYYADENGRIYQLICYAAEPTADFREVGGTHTIGGVVGSPIMANLQPATVEQLGAALAAMARQKTPEQPSCVPLNSGKPAPIFALREHRERLTLNIWSSWRPKARL